MKLEIQHKLAITLIFRYFCFLDFEYFIKIGLITVENDTNCFLGFPTWPVVWEAPHKLVFATAAGMLLQNVSVKDRS